MNDHVIDRLEAYYDGELHGNRKRQVEAHLAQCQECQERLQGLQVLSNRLLEVPAPGITISPERFVAQVGLRLPREQNRPLDRRLLSFLWRVSPVLLFAAWAFVQAVLWVTNFYYPALGFMQLEMTWFIPISQSAVFSLALTTVVTVIFGLLYMSWFAAWWAIKDNHKLLPNGKEA